MYAYLQKVTDGAAAATAVATFVGWLPNFAALFTIVWLGVQITEKIVGKPFSEIVRCVFARFRRRV
jgi:hypothetical protein